MKCDFDVFIIGGGAAGLFCAANLDPRLQIAVAESAEIAKKIKVSGGGRCNFTNFDMNANHFFGENPQFVKSAIAGFGARNSCDWIKECGLDADDGRELGRMFCVNGAGAVAGAITRAARKNARFLENTSVLDVSFDDNGAFTVATSAGNFSAKNVVVATGGAAAFGYGDTGYKIAKKFGHKIVPPRPALCGIKTSDFGSSLSGISLPVQIKVGREKITADLLFTHNGIGGPAVFRATARNAGDIIIDFLPDENIFDYLVDIKARYPKKSLLNAIADKMPKRVAEFFAGKTSVFALHIAEFPNDTLRTVARYVHEYKLAAGTFSLNEMARAEAVRGGVSTVDVSSRTMESKLQNGLYFIGETLDICGDLGGYNIHFAFASGLGAARAMNGGVFAVDGG